MLSRLERDPAEFPGAGGEMGARIRALDWQQTPLGASNQWPQSLKVAIQIMLASRYAMWMAWGEQLTFFCNDAYKPTLGVKESWAQGHSAREVWAEIWPDIGPRIETVSEIGRSDLGRRPAAFPGA